MKRIAARAASARRGGSRLLLGACGLISLIQAAAAGDRAAIDWIGFSEDGTIFAFEEYGIADGSGFAYSTLYVVDLVADAYVDGSPFRRIAQDEGPLLDSVREQVRAMAAPALEARALNRPVEVAALIGDGAVDADPLRLEWGLPAYMRGELQAQFELRLKLFDIENQKCRDWFGDPAKGFALTLMGEEAPREVHRDVRLPESRGCPLDYRLYAVLLPQYAQSPSEAVVIVSSYPFGFEGPDRRFLAVPLR